MSSKVTEGQLSSKGLRFAIIVARFNSFITERLLAGAVDALARTGCAESDIEIVKVPGSWEMPVVARELAQRKRYDALICLGAVIRGDTPHFDYVAGEAAKGLGQIAAQRVARGRTGVARRSNRRSPAPGCRSFHGQPGRRRGARPGVRRRRAGPPLPDRGRRVDVPGGRTRGDLVRAPARPASVARTA